MLKSEWLRACSNMSVTDFAYFFINVCLPLENLSHMLGYSRDMEN